MQFPKLAVHAFLSLFYNASCGLTWLYSCWFSPSSMIWKFCKAMDSDCFIFEAPVLCRVRPLIMTGSKNWMDREKNGRREWMSVKARRDSFHYYGYTISNPRTYWNKTMILLDTQESRRIWIRNLGRSWLESSHFGSVLWLYQSAGVAANWRLDWAGHPWWPFTWLTVDTGCRKGAQLRFNCNTYMWLQEVTCASSK